MLQILPVNDNFNLPQAPGFQVSLNKRCQVTGEKFCCIVHTQSLVFNWFYCLLLPEAAVN